MLVDIKISEIAYEKLSHWASVGRTIDAAVAELLERDTEQANFTVEELLDLKYALDDCNRACKEVCFSKQ